MGVEWNFTGKVGTIDSHALRFNFHLILSFADTWKQLENYPNSIVITNRWHQQTPWFIGQSMWFDTKVLLTSCVHHNSIWTISNNIMVTFSWQYWPSSYFVCMRWNGRCTKFFCLDYEWKWNERSNKTKSGNKQKIRRAYNQCGMIRIMFTAKLCSLNHCRYNNEFVKVFYLKIKSRKKKGD